MCTVTMAFPGGSVGFGINLFSRNFTFSFSGPLTILIQEKYPYRTHGSVSRNAGRNMQNQVPLIGIAVVRTIEPSPAAWQEPPAGASACFDRMLNERVQEDKLNEGAPPADFAAERALIDNSAPVKAETAPHAGHDYAKNAESAGVERRYAPRENEAAHVKHVEKPADGKTAVESSKKTDMAANPGGLHAHRVSPEKARTADGKKDAGDMMRLSQHVLNLMSFLGRMPEFSKDLKDLKPLFSEVRNAAAEKNPRNTRNGKLLDALVKKIDELMKKAGGAKAFTRPDDVRQMGAFRDELAQARELLRRLTRKTGKGADRTAPDLEVSEGRARSQDVKAALAQPVLKDEGREGAGSKHGNASNNFGPHIFKSGAAHDRPAAAAARPAPTMLFEEHLQSIVQNARVVVKDAKNGSFHLKLHPESLGSVNVKLGLEHGAVTGRFLVDSVEVKQALMENIEIIKERLSEAGIALGEFQVNVRDQRGRFGDMPGEAAFPAVKGPGAAVHERYEAQTGMAHNGAIDVII